MDKGYFYPDTGGGKWYARVKAEGAWRDIHQDRPRGVWGDAEAILRALGIPTTSHNIARYFPDTAWGRRCPTLELFELTTVLDPTNPNTKNKRGEVGV